MKVRKRTWTSGGKNRSGWQMDYTCPLTGERKRENLKGVFPTKYDAEQYASRIYGHLCEKAKLGEKAGPAPSEKRLTLKQLLDHDSKRAGARERTIKSEQCHGKPLLLLIGETMPVISITTAEVERFKTRRLAHGVSNRTVNLSLELLRAALNRAAGEGRLSKVPCDIKKLPEKPKKKRILEPAEISALIQACRPGVVRDVVTILANTGLRPCEVWRLTWGDVIANQKLLYAESFKRGAAGQMNRKPVPLSPSMVRFFEDLRKERWGRKVPPHDALVFPDRKGCAKLENVVKTAAKRSGIHNWEQVSPYVLRHTFATRVLQSGATVKDLQELIRHANPMLTISLYAQESMPNMRSAVEKVAIPDLRHKSVTTDEEDEPLGHS